ncbi:neprilysin-1-like [Bombus flavifrons]|uniref:neprilysin-1-like n=1 Tax=Bombus flavifrons TaxID=103934 RepID=UPI0037039BF3
MISRGSYQIANMEAAKAARRDQSYRSCVLSLIIFFFLCMILILVSLPWKLYRSYNSEEKGEYAGTTQHHYHEHHTEHETERTTSTTDSIKLLITTTSMHEMNSIEVETETTLNFEVFTENSHVINDTNSDIVDSSKSNIETTAEDISQTKIYKEIATEEFDNSIKVETETTLNFEVFTENSRVINDTNSDIVDSSKSNIETTAEDLSQTKTYKETVAEEFDNSSTTNINITENSTSISTKEHQETDTTDQYTTETFTTTDSDYINQETPLEVEESTEDVIKLTMKEENVTIKSTTKEQQNERYSSILNNETTSTTFSSPIDKPVCHEGECKNLASKILFYMNHTVDPCEDFYEYACGNFENNPQIVEWNLEDVAYQRILGQMQEENEKNISSIFTTYYNSCIQYESINRAERIKLAREALDKVGKFYTKKTWPKKHINFTELLATLLLKNSTLLFDIVPDLDEYSPTFTLKISPTTYDDLFEIDENNEPCYANKFERENETVNLEELYMEYKTCKVDTKKLIKSITEALTMLGVFNEPNIAQNINLTIINIDLCILQSFTANFPSKNKIREAELTKNYTLITVKQLDSEFKIINWTHLIYLLTNEKVQPEVKVQVYFYDALSKGLKNLEKFEEDPMTLHNALLGLYVHNLYHKLIISKHPDVKKHCLRVAANVLIPEASNLYISSFTNDQLTYMNRTIYSLFETLKETLKLKLTNVTWITEAERNALIAKINNLNVAVPDISYYTDSESTYRKILANQINLTNNYFENSVILMQRYRKLIYAELSTKPGYSAQIWTHYATPYQSKGLAIYGLNLVVIPYGVIDWSMKYNESSFNYIKLATLGNIIAHQIAHHFDATGIYYWNGNRNASSLLNDNDSTNMNFKDYIDYQRNVLYKNSMAMTLSFTGQNVLYKISQLTLNERLSEAMGLRLAYDTLAQLMSRESWLYLPWLELDFNKLFYLIYAQMYCTKSPLTSSYISLYENEQLPNRIHIFVSASNNRLLGETWNCPEGSRIMPSYVCSAFPYIQCNEEATIT